MNDSIQKLAQLRARKSKKSLEELQEEHVAKTMSPYEDLEWDDPELEQKMKFKQKYKPFYDRLKNKG